MDAQRLHGFTVKLDTILLAFREEVRAASAGNPAKRKVRLQHETARTRNAILAALEGLGE